MDNKDFYVDNVRLRPDEQIGLHSHSNWELSLVVKGAGIRHVGDDVSPFSDGDLVIIPPEIPHCWHFDGTATDSVGRIANITVKFTSSFLDRCATVFPALDESISALKEKRTAFTFDSVRKKEITAMMHEIAAATPRDQCHLAIRLITSLTAPGDDIAVGHSVTNDRIRRRLDMIRIYTSCNLCRHITIDEIARHVGMNRSAFCSFFKKASGESYVTYLNRRRIDKVCERLIAGDTSVADIAYTCGFNNIPYFNRVFRRLTGISPNRYRSSKTLI